MPTSIEQITVLISHTNEMSDHAVMVREKIEKMNTFLLNDGYSLMPLDWKRDVASGHASDGQQVINQSLVDKADIVIALFGSKAGSPTPRGLSGTAEELMRVKKRSNSQFGQHNAQAYFHNKQIRLSDLNLEEASALINLKKTLRDEGIVTVDYSDDRELLDLVENGIRGALHQFGSDMPTETQPLQTIDDEKPGLLDAQADMEENMSRATLLMKESGALMENFTPELNQISSEISVKSSPAERKELLDKAADLMLQLAVDLSDNGSEMSECISSARVSVLATLEIISEDMADQLNKEDVSDLRETLLLVSSQVSPTLTSLDGLRDVLMAIPRMTSKLNRAKFNLIEAVEKNRSAILSFKSLADEAADKAAILQP